MKTFTPLKKQELAHSLNNRFNHLLLGCAVFLSFLFPNAGYSQCSTSGTGNVTGNVSFGDPINWANPNRATLSDDLYARATLDSGETTKYLMVADFNYLIPPGATILGIEAKIEVHEDYGADGADASIRLMKAGTPVGSDYAGTGLWEFKDTTNFYGGSTDLWGTTWTPADVNSPGFGILISAKRNSGPNALTLYIDYVDVTVYFQGDGCVLPMKLSSFNAQRKDDHSVVLDWETLSEANNGVFNIERSADGINFGSIGNVAGSGTTQTLSTYSFTDNDAMPVKSYYRLMQIDYDGNFTYSPVVEVNGVDQKGISFQVWPNPADDFINVSFSGMNDGEIIAGLTDLQGKLIMEKVLNPTSPSQIDLSDISPGMYILSARSQTGTTSARVVVR